MSPISAPADRRFRRSHTKPGRRRSRWRAAARAASLYAVLAMSGAAAVYGMTDLVVHARVLRIERVEVRGNARMPTGEVLAVLDGMRGENILLADLDAWRNQLLASPWVLDATLRRSLPSTIEVTVSERAPMAIARLDGSLYLIDERGTVIDLYGPQYADLDLPIVDGLTPERRRAAGASLSTDQDRAALAASVILALAPQPALARRLSQIDVSDRHNVAVILAGDPAVISVGTDRFLARLQQYVELAATLRERVPDIDQVDLRFDDRIYVRPASAPRASVPMALRPGGQRVPARDIVRR